MIKTCVSSYSFGWQSDESQLGTLGVIEKAHEMGFDGIEFVENDYTNLDKAHLIKDELFFKGKEISGRVFLCKNTQIES